MRLARLFYSLAFLSLYARVAFLSLIHHKISRMLATLMQSALLAIFAQTCCPVSVRCEVVRVVCQPDKVHHGLLREVVGVDVGGEANIWKAEVGATLVCAVPDFSGEGLGEGHVVWGKDAAGA